RMCLVGPQRDDLAVGLDEHAARTFASRGQVRSIVLALKLAELHAARARGQAPLFLLDDLSSELDHERTLRLVHELRALDAQVWITTTDPDHLGELPRDERVRVAVTGGRVVVEPG
ncbi:MAG TPA: DNA replication and repair protein RecF, partial [Myxococcota bacterium]|nr:DNA replication and repair protein RecF [Myxococcota bacterium]